MTLFYRLIAAVALMLALPVVARESAAPPAPVQLVEARPALWKVADDDTTIWLFGTVHILPPGIDWYRGPVAAALRESHEMVTEIVEPDPSEVQAILTKHIARSDGKLLRDTLTEDERSAYEAALLKLGLPVAAFDGFDTWYAAVLMSSLPLIQQGYSPAHGVEAYIVREAGKSRMERTALETMDYQLGLFDGLADPLQRAYLDEIVRQMPSISTELTAMVNAWKAGDAEALARLMNEDESDPMLMKILITDRNRNWSQWIGKRLETPGTVFMAVGAGHLAGEGSVQEQLAEQGIEAVRVQ